MGSRIYIHILKEIQKRVERPNRNVGLLYSHITQNFLSLKTHLQIGSPEEALNRLAAPPCSPSPGGLRQMKIRAGQVLR